MENVNSCCFVGRIEQINPIEGADKVVQSIISGWECVIPKDKYKVGDLLVIATTDAVIPSKLAEDLGVLSYLKNRKKTGQLTVKTTKLRGVYSTAMIVCGNVFLPEGTDMMRDLDITKYEEPEVMIKLSSGKKIRTSKHPDFHVYHKFPNIKNAPGIFNEDDDIKITRKIHGCNARYGIVRKPRITLWNRIQRLFGNRLAYYDYVYGSHQTEKGVNSVHFYDEDVWAKIGEKYRIEEKLRDWALFLSKYSELGEGVILYGEIYGPGIQKYYEYNLKELAFKLFDIKQNGEYINTDLFESHCINIYSIEFCDKYYEGKYDEEEIKKWQFNRFIEGTKVPEEGVVVSSLDGDRAKIAKFINPAYLEFQSKKEDSTDFH